jgi:preprotein translocase subunit SecB
VKQKDIETYLFVKNKIAKYKLGIDITSKPLKNKLIEINTNLKFQDNEENDKRSHF